MMLFSNIFDSLSKMDYEPELFGKALPCLIAIGTYLTVIEWGYYCLKNNHREKQYPLCRSGKKVAYIALVTSKVARFYTSLKPRFKRCVTM